MLNQEVLYFETNGIDGNGNRTFSEPVQIDGRWENDQTTVLNKNGQELISNVTLHVSRVLIPGSQVYQGRRKNLSIEELANPNIIGLKIHDCSPLVTMKGFTIGYESNLIER